MAKLVSMFLVLIAIQLGLLLYTAQSPVTSDIYTFITNMTQWGTGIFILTIGGIAAGVGLVGIAAASVFGFKTDFLIFAPAMAGFISMGVIFTNLAQAIQADFAPRVCGALVATGACAPVNLLVAFTVGPIAFYYVWVVVEWWRGKDY